MTGRSVHPESLAGDPIAYAGDKQGGDASPNPPTVDDRYARLLAEDLNVKPTTARTAFIGEPVARALEVRDWAFERAPESPEKRAKLILGWAKRKGAGAFRSDADDELGLAARVVLGEVRAEARLEQVERGREQERLERLAKALAGMWIENPASLAEAIRALEHSRNGRS